MSNTEIIASLGLILSLITAIIGIYKFLDARKRELKWKRTEFVFEQAKYLDNDKEIILALAVLCKTDSNYKIESIFSTDGKFIDGVEHSYMIGFEKLLNLLDRLVYAYRADVITKGEFENFGMYLEQVLNNTRVSKYADANGYADVVTVAGELA